MAILQKDNIVGKGQTTTANGTTVNNYIVNIKDIDIAGIHLHNIHATVVSGQNVPLLLGQTALKQLGVYTIDGNHLILENAASDLTNEDIDRLTNEVYEYMDNKSYNAALSNLIKLKDVGLILYDEMAM